MLNQFLFKGHICLLAKNTDYMFKMTRNEQNGETLNVWKGKTIPLRFNLDNKNKNKYLEQFT